MADSAPTPELLVEEGLRLYNEGRLEDALSRWRLAAARDPLLTRAREYIDYVESNRAALESAFGQPGPSAGVQGGPPSAANASTTDTAERWKSFPEQGSEVDLSDIEASNKASAVAEPGGSGFLQAVAWELIGGAEEGEGESATDQGDLAVDAERVSVPGLPQIRLPSSANSPSGLQAALESEEIYQIRDDEPTPGGSSQRPRDAGWDGATAGDGVDPLTADWVHEDAGAGSLPSLFDRERADQKTLERLGENAGRPMHLSGLPGSGVDYRAIDATFLPRGRDEQNSPRRQRVTTMVRDARRLINEGLFEASARLCEKALEVAPGHDDALKLQQRAERVLLDRYREQLSDLSEVPVVLVSHQDIMWQNLDHRSGFLLSRVDGVLSYQEILDVCGMKEIEAYRILVQLLEEGLIGPVG